MKSIFLLIGAISGFFAVTIGAFGAHALSGVLIGKSLSQFQTGTQYLIFHSSVLLACGALSSAFPQSVYYPRAGWFIVAGQFVFSGSLYALALSGKTVFGAITPIGGVCYLIGWVMLGIGYFK